MTDTLTDDALLARLREQETRREELLHAIGSPLTSNFRVNAHHRAELEYARLYDEAKRRGIADRLELPE